MADAAQKRKPDGRGGARPGSGAPKGNRNRARQPLSVRQLKEFERAAEAKAKETGKGLQQIVLDIAYDEDAAIRDRLAAAKLFWDKSIIVASEGGEADHAAGPAFYLPEKRPVLEAIKGGK